MDYIMKKDTNTMINLDVKSNLAKLLATENITIQHNNVKTASFDVKNRVLTLPIFKQKSGDVYDMSIAHECAHALYTPYEEWEGITDNELRSYVNVIEDTRIDKLIQKKYPGVVKNYENGFKFSKAGDNEFACVSFDKANNQLKNHLSKFQKYNSTDWFAIRASLKKILEACYD